MPGTTPRGYPYPLYSEANNFPSQLQSLANAVDTDIQANLVTAVNNGLNQPSVACSSTVAQSVANNTDVTMTFNVEEYDNANWFNSGVSTTNFTAPATGFYMLSCSLVYASNATGGRTVIVKVGGVTQYAKTFPGNSIDITQIPTTNLLPLTAGNVVTVAARQNSGVAINVTDKRISINRISV